MKKLQISILALLISSTSACYNSDCLPVDPICSPLTTYLLFNSITDQVKKIHLVVHGNNTNTTSVYDPATNQFFSGPTLSGIVSTAGHSYRTKDVGRYWEALAIHGNGNQTSIWQPTTGTSYGSFITGPNLTGNTGLASVAGGRSFPVKSGTHAGKFYIIHAGGLASTSLFNPTTNSIQAGTNTSSGVGSTSTIAFSPTSGSLAGQTILPRTAAATSTTDIYNPATNTFANSITISAPVTDGSSTFPITTGSQAGNVFLICGNNTTTIYLFNSSTNTFSVITPALSASVSFGGFAFTLSNGKTLIIHGVNSNVTTLYDPSTDSHTPGPVLPFNANDGANGFLIEWGTHAGKYIIVAGNTTASSALYDPVANTFTSGPNLTGNVNTGASNFEIPVLQ